MEGHRVKFQPVTLFGKLVGASLFLTCPLTWAEPATTSLSGTATIQLKNSDSPQNLSGMDLAIAPLSDSRNPALADGDLAHRRPCHPKKARR